ncbi:ferritin-like domain-containing protein [Nocardioides sp. CN2-186]|uniref:ferritin-like domain-containing protein n=1 Tax=Nocardioides tweenelious TaxID=3156607 RepID=UPI0032B3CB91
MSETDALQTTLAAEHAAVYVYGVLGGRTSRSAERATYDAISSAYDAHRARRDQLAGDLRDAGADPVAAEAAYEVAGPIVTVDQITRAARAVEESCAATYSWLVAETTADLRHWAIQALNETAVRVLTLRGTPETFPGVGEYADR